MAVQHDEDPEFGEVTLDMLTPSWRIYQLRKGHRFSNDDKLCAWMAAEIRPNAMRILDIGSGIGSVGLSLLWRLSSEAHLTMVEAQKVSVRLARRSLAENGLETRVRSIEMDLRCFRAEEKYDLITGSPPYFAAEDSVLSSHSQKAHCRIELRGGLDEYCEAASRCLADDGVFVFVMAAADQRCWTSPERHGLFVAKRIDFLFKDDGRKPHVCVVACGKSKAGEIERWTMILRDADGKRTLDYRAWQEYMQLPPGTATLGEIKNILRRLLEIDDDDGLSALQSAVDDAEALGLRDTKGSDELRAAKRHLSRS